MAATARRRKPPTIIVDGIRYKIPPLLRDLPDEQIAKVIRGWRRATTAGDNAKVD